ncbi:carbohydrate kinase [Algibacter aquimarinus]|uniref:Carbohydrate kinase n=1 Tax=Algibacter aquimarinus TaxID=1136748 RepID=A0ABP9H5G5_9FLAO
MPNIVCFGEVLWDVFPHDKKIGGAPLNVAVRSKLFGNEVSIISAVGNDKLGISILDYLKENKVNTDCVQLLDKYKTGEVKVTLNSKGSASYSIEYPSAWDKISITELSKNKVKKADALVFGSLITRDNVSKETLFELVKLAKYKVFDLNLRPPHFKKDILIHLMEQSDFIKLNDEELYQVSNFLGSKFNSLEQNLKFIAKKTNTKHLCVTKGSFGAVLLYNEKLYYNSGYKIKVDDTVGAGDSFLGSLISQLLSKENPQKAINLACAVGALVAQNKGANPELSFEDIDSFMNPQ